MLLFVLLTSRYTHKLIASRFHFMVLVFYVPVRHQRLPHDKFNSYRGMLHYFLILDWFLWSL